MKSFVAIAAVVASLLLVIAFRRSDERVEMPSGELPGSAGSIEQALLAGRKIEAIKIYREDKGVGLRKAKEAIDELQHAINAR